MLLGFRGKCMVGCSRWLKQLAISIRKGGMSRTFRLLSLVAGSTVIIFIWILAREIILQAATVNHYVYVFPPGSVDVYDMDNNFALVKSVPLAQTKGQSQVYARGVVASAATGMLYLSYGSVSSGGSLLKYNLSTDTVVWTQTYSFGVDSMSISPDGQKIYMPTGEGAYTQGVWQVIDANTGSPVGQIDSGGKGPHNTTTSLNGAHIYMGPRYSNYLVLADTATLSVIRNIGPVSAGVRPFTIDAAENYAFTTTSGNVGFYVASIATGQNLFWVCPSGFCWTSGSYNTISGVSHGISVSPDNKEVYLIDLPYNHVHVFDVTGLPNSAPTDVADIPLKCTLPDEGWLQHSRDGRFVYVGDCGDVIDTSTRQIVANMPSLLQTRIFNEVDFQNGTVYFSPLSRNQGGYNTSPSNVKLSSATLSFGNQTVGVASSAQSTTLTNTGTTALAITGIAVGGPDSGDFNQTNSCGTSLAAGANCAISVTFNPSVAGSRSAVMSITDSDASSPQTVNLTGTGVAPTTTATVSPGSLTFPNTTVGSTSATQMLTLTNTGAASLMITNVSIAGDFAQTDNCGTSLSAGGNCTINVSFKPTASGSRTGTLSIADNTSSSPQNVALVGTGTSAPAPVASWSPSTLTFSSTTVGATSSPLSVTFSNIGNAPLTISSVSTSGDFAQTNTCGSSVAAGANCVISVSFKPTASGTRTGTLSIADNSSSSPQNVALTGTGAAVPAPLVSLSPSSLTFSSTTVGATSSPLSVTLSNTGNASLSISGIYTSGDFAQTNTCGSSVAVGANCGIHVTFTPTAAGTRTGLVSVTDTASGSPQSITLTGNGTTTTASPSVTLNPSLLNFASTTVGTTSSAKSITLSNTGAAALTITNVSVTGDFAETNNCGSSVAVGASCTFSVTFAPTASGVRNGAVNISDNATGSPQSVALSGDGSSAGVADFGVSVTPASVATSAGQSATFSVAITPVGGFNQQVNLSCLGAPQGAQCSISPSSVTPSGTVVNATMTVTTTAHATAPLLPVVQVPPLWPEFGRTGFLLAWAAAIFLVYRVSCRRLRVRLAWGLGVLVLAVSGIGCTGLVQSSGVTSSSTTGTPAGTYTLTLSGSSGSSANQLTHSTTATLTVH